MRRSSNRRRAVWRVGVVVMSWLALGGAGEAQQSQPPPPPTQPEPEPMQEAGGRLVVSGETVVVRANPDQPPRESSVATKIDTPLLETPRSISIIDRQTLDEMGAINLTQAHDYAVGVTLLDERGPAFARGFPVDFYDLRRDGLRTYSWSVREPVGLERVQYLRGPAAVLYGDGSPGALVNMVLKQPLPAPRYEFAVSGGSLGFGRVTGDLTGPLTTCRSPKPARRSCRCLPGDCRDEARFSSKRRGTPTHNVPRTQTGVTIGSTVPSGCASFVAMM